MICAGIDAGSRAIKVVLLDGDALAAKGRPPNAAFADVVVASGAVDQGVRQGELALGLFDQLVKGGALKRTDVARVVATGYARKTVDFADTTITEITCHACGVWWQSPPSPEGMTIVEIGGQDSKLIRLAGDGTVRDFDMNDRCAAGTGRFLEMVADRLGVELGQLGELAGRSKSPAAISSMCAVFAETEIIGLLAAGRGREDIIAGVQTAIASRLTAMAGRNLRPPVVFTGGVAMICEMDAALEKALGRPVTVAPNPQMTGALGAAILAARQCD